LLRSLPRGERTLREIYSPNSEAWYLIEAIPRLDSAEMDVHFKDITAHVRAESEVRDDPHTVALALFDGKRLLSYSEPLHRLVAETPLTEDSIETLATHDTLRMHPAQWRRALSGARTAWLFLDPKHAVSLREKLIEDFVGRNDLDIMSRMSMRLKEVLWVEARQRSSKLLGLASQADQLRAKFEGVHRALLHRYMEETLLPEGESSWPEYLRTRRRSHELPCVHGGDRRYDYLLILRENESLGYFYPKTPLTDAELVLHTCAAMYDDLAGRGSERMVSKYEWNHLTLSRDGLVVLPRLFHMMLAGDGRPAPLHGIVAGEPVKPTALHPGIDPLGVLAPPDALTHEPSDIEVESLARALYEHDPYSAIYWFTVTVWELSHYQVLRILGAGQLDGTDTELGRLRKQLDRKLPLWDEITNGWSEEEEMRRNYGQPTASVAVLEDEKTLPMQAELAEARRTFYTRNPHLIRGEIPKHPRKETGVKKDYETRLARITEEMQNVRQQAG
jgi:hypothetical protein